MDALEIYGAERPGRWVVTCDHATNLVPEGIDLGLPTEEMARHIAYDIGASGVAKALGAILDSPVIESRFSRLVIDPNRGEDDPTLIMQLYDGSVIPGNRRLSPETRAARLETLYRPYHRAYAELAARQRDSVICAVHSFTPRLKGREPRPWEIGILHATDARLSDPLIERLAALGLNVGRNEPYAGHLPGDAVDRHALAAGRLNTLIELRQDLIETEYQQRAWAERLAGPLKEALEAIDGQA
ncbi:MAG: N-formylglutamate amidohydrolase [Pseudomonadota bacterium]